MNVTKVPIDAGSVVNISAVETPRVDHILLNVTRQLVNVSDVIKVEDRASEDDKLQINREILVNATHQLVNKTHQLVNGSDIKVEATDFGKNDKPDKVEVNRTLSIDGKKSGSDNLSVLTNVGENITTIKPKPWLKIKAFSFKPASRQRVPKTASFGFEPKEDLAGKVRYE